MPKTKGKITHYKVEKFSTLREMLDKSAAACPDTIAFRYKENDVDFERTYSQFLSDTEALGAALTQLGHRTDHIACIGINSYKWAVTYLTVVKSACVFVPIDKELPTEDILNILIHSESRAIFCDESYLLLLKENAHRLLDIENVICFDKTENTAGSLRLYSFDTLLEDGRALDKHEYDILQNDPMKLRLLVYTSGTTGMAKGVMLSEHNLVSSVYYGMQVSTVYDTCLSVLPYHHTYEAVSGLLVSLHHRSTICINDKIRNVQKNLMQYHPSYIYLVPAFAEFFYKKINETIDKTGKRKDFDKALKITAALLKVGIDVRRKLFKNIHDQFGGRLIKIVCGGAPIRPEVGDFFNGIGINLINGYGITECSPLVSANNDTFNDPTTVGIKLPCVDIKIDNPTEDGTGEICVRGDVVMMGYYKNLEQTAKVLIDGWFYTGDYGRMNDQGQLLITGRKKNIIILQNGKNVYPEEIEAYIARLPYITDVIVRSNASKHGEQFSLIAEIYCEEGVGERSNLDVLGEVQSICAGLPPYKMVSNVIIRDEPFPKTTTKKIKRNYAS